MFSLSAVETGSEAGFAAEDEVARWQVSNTVMEALVAALARENAEVVGQRVAKVVDRRDAFCRRC
jgi:hypothetical protein